MRWVTSSSTLPPLWTETLSKTSSSSLKRLCGVFCHSNKNGNGCLPSAPLLLSGSGCGVWWLPLRCTASTSEVHLGLGPNTTETRDAVMCFWEQGGCPGKATWEAHIHDSLGFRINAKPTRALTSEMRQVLPRCQDLKHRKTEANPYSRQPHIPNQVPYGREVEAGISH